MTSSSAPTAFPLFVEEMTKAVLEAESEGDSASEPQPLFRPLP